MRLNDTQKQQFDIVLSHIAFIKENTDKDKFGVKARQSLVIIQEYVDMILDAQSLKLTKFMLEAIKSEIVAIWNMVPSNFAKVAFTEVYERIVAAKALLETLINEF